MGFSYQVTQPNCCWTFTAVGNLTWSFEYKSNSVQLFHLILCRGLAEEPSLSGAKNPCRERSSYFIVFKTTAINDRQNSWSSSWCRSCPAWWCRAQCRSCPAWGPRALNRGGHDPPSAFSLSRPRHILYLGHLFFFRRILPLPVEVTTQEVTYYMFVMWYKSPRWLRRNPYHVV